MFIKYLPTGISLYLIIRVWNELILSACRTSYTHCGWFKKCLLCRQRGIEEDLLADFFFKTLELKWFSVARWAFIYSSRFPSRHTLLVAWITSKKKTLHLHWKTVLFRHHFKQTKLPGCAVTNEFVHKCWVCFGKKRCFVFFICNKTFTAPLAYD